MESAQRESITGLGRRPQWAERGPGKPLCVKTFKVSDNQRKQQIRLILCILHTGETSSKRDQSPAPIAYGKTLRIAPISGTTSG